MQQVKLCEAVLQEEGGAMWGLFEVVGGQQRGACRLLKCFETLLRNSPLQLRNR